MHKDYIAYCQAVINKIPDIHFLVVGDQEENLRNEACEMGLAEYFSFTGYVDNVYEQYQRMDVMGYLVREPEEYAECLNKLYGSKELRQRIGTEARNYVIRNYSIADTTAKFLDSLYNMLPISKKEQC